MRKREKRALIKEKQRQRTRTPAESSAMDKILSEIRQIRDRAVNHGKENHQ